MKVAPSTGLSMSTCGALGATENGSLTASVALTPSLAVTLKRAVAPFVPASCLDFEPGYYGSLKVSSYTAQRLMS